MLTPEQLRNYYSTVPDTIDNIYNKYGCLRILFLDIDGVLNSEEYFSGRLENKNWSDIDTVPVAKLNQLDGCVVVISSSWGYNKHTLNALQAHGLELPIISGVSPYHTDYGTRGLAISYWLEAFMSGYSYEYAILDDDDDMLDSQSDHFVRTDFRYGLTDKDLEEVKKILKIS